jgi:hypothetical protein
MIYVPFVPTDGIWKKLNLKDQSEIVVLNAPESFEGELARLGIVTVRTKVASARKASFALAFGTKQAEVDAFASSLNKLADGDIVVWFAYPKGSSKRYTCEFNRDTGWKSIGAKGFEPVRMVAIDEDWSALRFRRVDFIEEMKRPAEWAMTAKGKAKSGKAKAGTAKAGTAKPAKAKTGKATRSAAKKR